MCDMPDQGASAQLDENQRSQRQQRRNLNADHPAEPAVDAGFEIREALVQLLDDPFQTGQSGSDVRQTIGFRRCGLHCVIPLRPSPPTPLKQAISYQPSVVSQKQNHESKAAKGESSSPNPISSSGRGEEKGIKAGRRERELCRSVPPLRLRHQLKPNEAGHHLTSYVLRLTASDARGAGFRLGGWPPPHTVHAPRLREVPPSAPSTGRKCPPRPLRPRYPARN